MRVDALKRRIVFDISADRCTDLYFMQFVGADADEETKKLQARFNSQSKTAVFRRIAAGSLPVYEAGKAKGGLPGRYDMPTTYHSYHRYHVLAVVCFLACGPYAWDKVLSFGVV